MFTYIDSLTQNTEISNLAVDIYADLTPIAMDTETTGLSCFSDKLILLQLKLNGHTYILNVPALGDLIREILTLIQHRKRVCILHNAKFDLKFLYHNTKVLLTNVYDTQLTEVMLTAGIGSKFYSLADLVLQYCDVLLDKTVRAGFYGDDAETVTQEKLIYSALDVEYLSSIKDLQMKKVTYHRLEPTLELECKLIPVVAMMEYTGAKLDIDAWTTLAKANTQEFERQHIELKNYIINHIPTDLFGPNTSALDICNKLKIPVSTKRDKLALSVIVGEELIKEVLHDRFNLGSHVQLKSVLESMGLVIESTNEKILRDHKNDFEVVEKILDFREVEKRESTYGLTFLENVNPVTGRIHTEYQNIGAATGRFSSGKPNLQNVPRGSAYRSCFVADEGKVLISCDYSQQEYRLAGAVSREPVIIQAYKNGLDMHTATASIVTGKPAPEISKEDRNVFGKPVNFAILYGSTEYGLAYNMKLTLTRALEILNSFYAGYPILSAFKKAAENIILERRYSVTPMGRKRFWKEEDPFLTTRELQSYRNQMKREGFNHIIQGGGADITKLALVKLFYENPFGDKFKILLQVHDEIVVEADEDIKDVALEFMKKCMIDAEQPFLGDLPAAVDGEYSKVWKH